MTTETAETATLSLRVNGEAVSLQARAEDTLLSVLRDRLFLTGAKRGCNQGVCGACTVLLDGKAARACLALAANCEGREITTVEGLASGGRPSPLQQAFVEAGAIQCGFCTPGMLIALTELLAETPAPDRDRIREAVSGNLCRCSGYAKIVEAGVRASRGLPEATP